MESKGTFAMLSFETYPVSPGQRGIGQHGIKKASVVCNIENSRVPGNIFFTEDGNFTSGNPHNQFEYKLDNTEGRNIPGVGRYLSDHPFCKQDRNR